MNDDEEILPLPVVLKILDDAIAYEESDVAALVDADVKKLKAETLSRQKNG